MSLDPTDPKRKEYLWKLAIEDLKSEWPLPYPLKIIRVRLKEEWGRASLVLDNEGEPSHFLVCVTTETGFNHQLDILIHEYAHCLDWTSTQEPGTDHGDTWGIWFARCYRAVIHD